MSVVRNATRSYLALKRVGRKRRRLLSKHSLVCTALLDRLLVELVEPQVVDEDVERHVRRPVKVAAALVVVQQGVERVPAAVEAVLGARLVVVLPSAAGVAEQRARVTGEGRPARLEAQAANVDRHPVFVVAVLRVDGRQRRRSRRHGVDQLVAGGVVAIGHRRLGVGVARDYVAYNNVSRSRHLAILWRSCMSEVSVLYFMEFPWNTTDRHKVFICFVHVILPWKTFSIKIPWNHFHGMFSMAIPRSIKLGHLKCRIANIINKGND